MQDIYNLIAKVADTDSTILIQGESGTGKELVARALHFNSNRQHQPFSWRSIVPRSPRMLLEVRIIRPTGEGAPSPAPCRTKSRSL